MIYVTSVDGTKVEPLINIQNDFKFTQSVKGNLSISFTAHPGLDNPGYDLLTPESIVNVDNYDFKVKQFRLNAFSKSVTAISTFFEHSKTQKDGVFTGSHTLNNHLSFVLNGTGWTFTVDAAVANVSNYIDKLGNDNIIALVEKLCKYHAVEYLILPNKRIHFAKQVGPDNDYQYRYKYNITDVVLTEDTSNLHTFIRGYGADGLEVSYTSPNFSKFGKLEAAPIRDDRFKNRNSLLNHIKNAITDAPNLAIDSVIPELTHREIGERVWMFYDPLNIEMQTRILQQTKVLIDGKLVTSNVVFGNTLPKTAIDTIVEQQAQINDTVSYVNDTKDEVIADLDESKEEYRSRFDQTDRQITMEVEQLETSIATLDLKADTISASVNNRITNEIAALTIKADNINASVNNRITNEIGALDIRADQIELSVSNLSANTSASISTLSDSISLKVDVGGSITDINLSNGIATINSEKINLNGATMVNGNITGTGRIDISTDAYVGNNIYLGAYNSEMKMLIFNGQNRISSTTSFMTVSAPTLYLGSRSIFQGEVDFSEATFINWGNHINTIANAVKQLI